jgi:anti-sigma B factor antagonist
MSHMQQVSQGRCWAGFGLSVTVTRCDEQRANLRLAGELDTASAALCAACFEYHLLTGRRFLRADLSGLAFIDTAGLEVLLDAHRSARAQHGSFILSGLNARTRRLVGILGLDTELLIAADPAESAAPVA